MTSTAPDNNNNNNIKNINNKIRINNGNANNNNNSKYRVLDTGSLIIDSVSVEDADEYVCRASSKVGRAEARVTLQVKDMDNLLPPIIIHGPQNQTLPQGETVTLTCTINHQSPSDDVTNFDDEKDAGYDNDEGGDENDDNDEAKIRWLKNNAPMKIDGVRVSKRSNGELVINDLRQSDTGTYTCSVISVSGETSWSAHLSVQSSSDPNVLFRRSPTISTFPGAPTTPLVNEVRQTSVRLSWKLNARRGSSEVEGSIVEVHCVECSTKTWTQRIYPGKSLTATINNLSPDTTYYFLVRSWNSHGIGAPSAVSSSVRTKGSKISPSISLADIKMILASQQLVRPMSAQSLSSTSIQVEWGSFDEYKDIIDEFVVRYQDIDRNSAIQSRRAYHHVNQMTLNGLEKFTLYEVNVLPVYMGHEGIPTTARVKTSEDAPSVAPSNVQVTWHNNDSLLITWDPPPTLTHNGPLRGYKVYVTNNNTRLVRATQVDENVESFMIGNVIRDHYYTVRVTCFNRVGESPSSLDAVVAGHLQPLPFPPTNSNNVVNESWFVVVVIVVMGTLLWGVLCLLSVCMFRRHKKNKKKKVLQDDAETALRGGTLPNMTSGNSQRVPAKSSSTTTASGSQFPLLNNNQLIMDCQTRLNRCCYDNSHSPTDSKDDCHVINENQGHTYQTLDAHQSVYPHTWNAFGSVIVPMPATNTTPHLDHQQQQSINQIGYFPSGEIPNPAAYMIRCPPANSSGGSSVVNQSETIIEANEDDHDLGYNVAGRCGAGSHCGSNSSYGGHNESGSAGKYYTREEAGKKFHFHNNKNNNNNYGNNNNFDNCNKYSSPHHSSAGSSLASANHESNQPLLYCYNGELDNIGPTMASSRYIMNGEPNHNNNNICNNHNNNICNNINNSNYYDQVPNDNVINNPYNNNNKKLHLLQQHCNTPESFISDTDCDGEDAPRIISIDDASTTSSTSTKSDNDVVVVGVADQNVAKQLQQQQQQQQQLKYQKPQIGFMTALNYNSKQQIASNNSSSINNNNGFCPTVKVPTTKLLQQLKLNK
ncbi:hypothetical protein HELRODRAFT_189275, partial [Helobdella robusta]|uniref:Uncharacterized protein n=2 Tax=Helobdella TaxID=6411 RepID=T1FQW7_HELRO